MVILLSLCLYLLPLSSPTPFVPPELLLPLPPDAVALLTFKKHADLDNTLHFPLQERFDFCSWQGVTCSPSSRVVRLALPSHSLRGTLPSASLSPLSHLRILILRNNSLSGPLPDLPNLKTLSLNHNLFSGPLPSSLFLLPNLRLLDLSFNSLSGPIPIQFNRLALLLSLRLEFNLFSGPLPPLNITGLKFLNVSGNNLTGEAPTTPTLSRFNASSFSLNPSLCGEILNSPCPLHSPPLLTNTSLPSTTPITSRRVHNRRVFAAVLSVGTLIVVGSVFCCVAALRGNRRGDSGVKAADSPLTEVAVEEVKEGRREKEMREAAKSGKLVFSVGETEAFTMEQLMRASAEMLGRGNLGTTYKAKLDNHLVVTVKRLDATRTAGVSGEAFDKHMERVGALRHPNVVPVRAFFQAKEEERLIVYDFQANGSVFNLVHGSRSTRTKPLHWTSCLKIAEDVAQGLAYIHQSSKLIHGNLKAANVLLGPDFEACVTDYCLYVFTDPAFDNADPDSMRYKAPEIRNLSGNRPPTIKSDVYSFGVLLVELLSGKSPSEHPFVAPPDLPRWVRSMRDQDRGEEEDDRLEMLVDVAGACSSVSPEHRPTMSHVLKMIQRIKNSVIQSTLSKESS